MRARVRWLAGLSLLAVPVSLPAQAPGTPPAAVPSIAVTGEGEARATPDRAFVTVGVETRAASAAAAGAENARRQRAILDTLRAMGFTPEQLSTANYSVRPEMEYDQAGRVSRVIGYVVSNTVRADVRQVERAGSVIDAALAKGANQVYGIDFYLANPSPVRQQAIVDAVARARADAETLARAAGGTLGPILELSTTPMPSGPVMYRMAADMAQARGAAASTPIEAGEQVVRATVNVRWQFVPAG